jgi:hypothetical protein
MFARPQKRKNRAFVFDSLEPRNLLTVVPIPTNQEILGISREAIIRASIGGSITSQVPIQGSATAFQISFSGQGFASKLGPVSISGQSRLDVLTAGRSHPLSYSGGSGTFVTPSGNLSLTFSGSGREQPNGVYTATLRGVAVGASGLFKGASTRFTAQVHGNIHSPGFSMTFTLGR